MEAKRLPNGNILVHVNAEDPKRWMYAGDMEITPSHPKFAFWDNQLKKNADNLNPEKAYKERKKRGEPRLDFYNPWDQDWLFVTIYNYPELNAPEEFIHEMEKRLVSVTELSRKEKKYLIEHLNPAPDPPNTGKRKFYYKEWDAWLAYYVLCQKAGKYITPQTIAGMTGYSYETVKSKFKAAKKRFYDYDYGLIRKEIESKRLKD
jgi:hypothetical protein